MSGRDDYIRTRVLEAGGYATLEAVALRCAHPSRANRKLGLQHPPRNQEDRRGF
jgi:hypothetical protein